MESETEYFINDRVALSLAVGRYFRSAEAFNTASREFTAACKELRGKIGDRRRFVCQVDFKYYLVTTDGDGNFDVEPIESL